MAWTAAAATIIAGVVALALVLGDHRATVRGAPAPASAARAQFDETMGPVSALFALPLHLAGETGDYVRGYFNAVDENRRLRAEVVELERYREAAMKLKNINERYEALLKLRTEPEAPMVAARVVADMRGPFSHARLADAGSDKGIVVGNPVLSEHGVIGRVVGVSRNVSRVLLLTDIDSRLPVLVNATNARAILAGDGGDAPKLQYLRGRDPIKRGDIILTSGDGGLYPRGLPVGVAEPDMFGQWRVRLYSDRSAIDYVRIMKFSDFSQLVDEAALSAHAAPPISAAEKAQVDAAVAARIASPKPGSAEAAAAATAAAPAPAGTAIKPDAQKPQASKPVAARPGAKPSAKPGTKPAAATHRPGDPQ